MVDRSKRVDLIDRVLGRTGRLAATIVALAVAWQTLRPVSEWLAYWAVWFIVLYGAGIRLNEGPSPPSRMIRRVLLLLFLVAGLFLLGFQANDYLGQPRARMVLGEFEKSLAGRRWIAYEPVGYDPYTGRFPAHAELVDELRVLKSAGFDGLITFGAQGSLGELPRIAKEQVGFRAVIMGIARVTEAAELAAAVAQSPKGTGRKCPRGR
jgi:hypothetical protein